MSEEEIKEALSLECDDNGIFVCVSLKWHDEVIDSIYFASGE